MTPHSDILDQPERLGGALARSLLLHVSVIGGVLILTYGNYAKREQWGDPRGGGIGAVAVNPIATIPLPARSGPVNPVANDTESVVPEVQTQSKPSQRVKAPEPDAIPIPSMNARERAAAAAAAAGLNKFRAAQRDQANQLTSSVGQRANTALYGMTGGGGVGVGNNSPFGTQFGWYATALRDQVARRWKTSELDPRLQNAPLVTVAFTIRRDGSVATGSAKVVQSSGNYALDTSSLRAVLDAAPFSPLPAQFSRGEAQIELTFALRR
jgi:periplasmic protein TonB